jgi:D-sedoheptulose 7-phosphate isomerase
LGRDGGSIKDVCDLALIVPSSNTPHIQEGHITIIHIVCDLVEKALFA